MALGLYDFHVFPRWFSPCYFFSCLCFEGGLALLFEFTSLFRPSGSMIPQICGAILSVSERLGLYQWFSLVCSFFCKCSNVTIFIYLIV